MIDRNIVNLYSRPQVGGDLTFFRGKQYGGNWKSVFGRYALPILKKFGIPIAKLAGKALWNAGKNVIEKKSNVKDALLSSAKEVLPDIKRHATDAIRESANLISNGGGDMEQSGSGFLHRYRRKRKLIQQGGGRFKRKHSINKHAKRLKTIFS